VQRIPGIVGAIDGTLIEIERPADFEGWYCRKGYPAINLQAVCDHSMRILSYSMMSGSHNDKQLWSHSTLGVNAHEWIPPGFHLIGDSGYTLYPFLIVPYPDDGDTKHILYNYKLSSTRMVIECAFGLLKNRWRILKTALNMKTIRRTTMIIEACILLHNMCIDFNDTTVIPGSESNEADNCDYSSNDDIAKLDALHKRESLCRIVTK
jgi:hypothetical protein